MIRDISRKYYEIWGDEEAQNVFLKGILAALSTLTLVQSIALVVLTLRKPILIAVSEKQTQVLTAMPPSEILLETELTRQVTRYIEAHYNWDFSSIETSSQNAERFISPAFVKSFEKSNAEQVKIIKEKKLSQTVYIAKLNVDSKQLSAQVTLDRILRVDGIRAVTPLVLSLTLESGSRTDANPEGLYITGEKITN